MHGEKETHPSFGMIGMSHTTSTPGQTLFGSEFEHQHYLTLKIMRAERERDLSRDWYFGNQTIIEVMLSEAQFCELITRTNMGDGVPCTIYREEGKPPIPPPPQREPIAKRFSTDMKKDTERCVADLRAVQEQLSEAIDTGKIGKTVLREIAAKLHDAACAIDRGIPFVEESFREAIEETTRHAAVEIEATVANIAMRLGIEQMKEIGASAPKLIEAPKLEPEDAA